MPICVISTVGASVFTQASEDIRSEWRVFDRQPGLDLQKIARGTHDFPGHDMYMRVLNYLHAIAQSPGADEGLARASAELKSLINILRDRIPNNNDKLHFFATDTPIGVLAARIISDFTRDYFSIETEVVRVEGLQVSDDTAFNSQGIRNLISRVYDKLEDAPKSVYRRVLNPTGGYKGVVPYLTLIGMIEEDVETSYIFEHSNSLITLRQVPITLDYARLSSAHDALIAAERDFISEIQLVELLEIDPAELSRHPALALFDIDDGMYSINGLGVIVLKQLGYKPDNEVYLSKQAKDAYDKLNAGEKKATYEKYFNGALWNRWIESHRHDQYKAGSGAIPLKLGQTNERVWVYIDGNKVLIAELTKHSPSGDYEIEPRNRDDYKYHYRWEVRNQ